MTLEPSKGSSFQDILGVQGPLSQKDSRTLDRRTFVFSN